MDAGVEHEVLETRHERAGERRRRGMRLAPQVRLVERERMVGGEERDVQLDAHPRELRIEVRWQVVMSLGEQRVQRLTSACMSTG